MKITYIFPTRLRPTKFFAALANLSFNSADQNYEIIAVLDNDDKTLNCDKSRLTMDAFKVRYYYGDSKSKVHAINRELDKISEDTEIVCLMSDDFVMTAKGFDNHIRIAFQDGFKGLVHFPDNRIAHIPQKTHAIGFNEWMRLHEWKHSPRGTWYKDGGIYFDKKIGDVYDLYKLELNQRLVTFPIMHISYLRRFGYIYHPDYKSVRSDEEMTEVAKRLGLYRYVDIQMMEHQHYRWGFNNGIPDELYKKNDSGEMYAYDKAIFEKRSKLNFDLK